MPKSKQFKLQGQSRMSTSYADLGNLGDAARSFEEKVHSENIYRASCLLAYASGVACRLDIKPFLSLAFCKDDFPYPEQEPRHGIIAEVSLPFMKSGWDNGETLEIFDQTSLSRRLNPDSLASPITRETSKDGLSQTISCVVHTIEEIPDDLENLIESYPEEDLQEICRVMGQAIVNLYAKTTFIGFFEGVPLFEPADEYLQAWQEMALLINTQLPAICPVCGKIVDRRTGGKGGRPPMTCKEHSDEFQNEKKNVYKLEDPSLYTKNAIEMKARELHFQDGKNARPLCFISDDQHEGE